MRRPVDRAAPDGETTHSSLVSAWNAIQKPPAGSGRMSGLVAGFMRRPVDWPLPFRYVHRKPSWPWNAIASPGSAVPRGLVPCFMVSPVERATPFDQVHRTPVLA